MSLLDVLRQEYVKGRVIDKYRLDNGSVGLVVEDSRTKRRYHVEFKDNKRGPCIENLFGFVKDPFEGKSQPVEKLVNEGDLVELTTSYSKGPFREAYRLHSVSNSQPYKTLNRTIGLP